MNTSTNRIAIVTGGSRGLGRSMALHLARDGADIIITYQQNEAAAGIVDEDVEAFAAPGGQGGVDLSCDATLAAWGRERFDILVNNAGSGLHVRLMELTEDQFDGMIAIHLKSALFLTQALAPRLNDGGRILNISSGLTRFTVAGAGAYAAAKGGVEVLTRYLARELAARRIAVNTLAPGAIATDFNGGRVRDDEALNGWVAAQTALGRAGLPDDIGGAAASLLAEGSGWITGQRIEASGGMGL
jgi:NAD(P)-dependent dehydrogenase (short-subunit alcohol dehydrogenase family)